MTSSASKIKLAPLAELFKSTEEIGMEHATEIELSDLFDYHNHPFYVRDDELSELIESIKQQGVLIPGIARKRAEGGYEMVAGHRRKRASELAGKKTMPVIVKALSDEDADLIMVDTNIHREQILPSEKAFAYRIKAEALSKQKSTGKSTEIIGGVENTSGKTIQRYIRLTYLVPQILKDIDKEKLAFMSGVSLSYLPAKIQEDICQLPCYYGISVENAEIVKNYYKYSEIMDRKLYQEILEGRYLKDEGDYYGCIINLFESGTVLGCDTQDDVKSSLQNAKGIFSGQDLKIQEKGVLFDGHKFIGWEKILSNIFPKIKEWNEHLKAVKKTEEERMQLSPVPTQENETFTVREVEVPLAEGGTNGESLEISGEGFPAIKAIEKGMPAKIIPTETELSFDEEKDSASSLLKLPEADEAGMECKEMQKETDDTDTALNEHFILNFHCWPIWFRVPEADEICYRYDLPDGCAIAVREYNAYIKWMGGYSDENPEQMHKKLYLLHPGYHYLNDCETNMTALVEHLKEVQKYIWRKE